MREIKLLKLLSHENILRLSDMAVEYPTRQGMLHYFWTFVLFPRSKQTSNNAILSRQAKKANHVHGHSIHGPRFIRSAR